jgi:hypothetical protein
MLVSAFQYFAGGLGIAIGLLLVLLGLLRTPANPALPLFLRIRFTLAGVMGLSCGGVFILGYIYDTWVYAQRLPALGWVLWVVFFMSLIGTIVTTLVAQLQREPPHGA